MPTWGKREEKKEVEPPTVEELVERASQLRAQAESMMGSAPAPSIRVQLGQVLLALDSKSFESMLKKWDQKGKGEFMKAEMRLNLRNAGLNISSAESDAMCVPGAHTAAPAAAVIELGRGGRNLCFTLIAGSSHCILLTRARETRIHVMLYM